MMNRSFSHYKRMAFRRLIIILAFAIAILASLIVLPLALLFTFSFALLTSFTMLKSRAKPTIEILPAEKMPIKSTKDIELEITIDNLQRNSKNDSLSKND